MAGTVGIEPTPRALETLVLPLYYVPVKDVAEQLTDPRNPDRKINFYFFPNQPFFLKGFRSVFSAARRSDRFGIGFESELGRSKEDLCSDFVRTSGRELELLDR